MIAHISAGSSGRTATGAGSSPRSVVEVGGVEEEVVVVEAEDTAELLPRAARAASSELMLITSPDPLSGWRVEAEVEAKEAVVVVGAVIDGGREQAGGARTQLVPLFSLEPSLLTKAQHLSTAMLGMSCFAACDMSGRPGLSFSPFLFQLNVSCFVPASSHLKLLAKDELQRDRLQAPGLNVTCIEISCDPGALQTSCLSLSRRRKTENRALFTQRRDVLSKLISLMKVSTPLRVPAIHAALHFLQSRALPTKYKSVSITAT